MCDFNMVQVSPPSVYVYMCIALYMGSLIIFNCMRLLAFNSLHSEFCTPTWRASFVTDFYTVILEIVIGGRHRFGMTEKPPARDCYKTYNSHAESCSVTTTGHHNISACII